MNMAPSTRSRRSRPTRGSTHLVQGVWKSPALEDEATTRATRLSSWSTSLLLQENLQICSIIPECLPIDPYHPHLLVVIGVATIKARARRVLTSTGATPSLR